MKVVSRQPNSKMCFVCGLDNKIGLKAPFYNMEDGSVMSKFVFCDEDQSYPDRVHGGLISTMLDEIAGRAIWVKEIKCAGVTIDMNVKYRSPVKCNEVLLARAIVIKESKLFFKTKAEILDLNHNVLAESVSNFIKTPLEKIGVSDIDDELCYNIEDDVIEL